nr:hypothetical protein [Nanoarchaeota archaeon]
MIRKKELQQENEELKKEKSELEQKVDFLKSELEKEMITNSELRKKIELLKKGGGWLDSVMDERTTNVNLLNLGFWYIERGKFYKAKLIFDGYYGEEKGKKHFIEVKTRFKKKLFLPAEYIQEDAELVNKWLTIRYENEKEAEVPLKVYNEIEEDKKKNPNLYLPNIPETIHFYDYIVMNEIIGSDLFIFFQELDKKPDTPAKRLLTNALIKKQLRDTAYIRTRNYGFDKSLIIRSSHGKKILEVFEKAKILLKKDEEEKLIALVQPLDSMAKYPLRDGASWNFMIKKEQAGYFLSDDFLFQKKPDYREIGYEINNSVYSCDFDKLIRLTFQEDEERHILYWPYPKLNHKDRVLGRKHLIGTLAEFGENVKHYGLLQTEKILYRDTRMIYFYMCNPENYPDPNDKYKQHHLRMAFYSLYRHTFGKAPSKNELNNASLENMVKLVMHPNC